MGNYYWCRHSGDGSWDYCSLDEKHTRYGEDCTSACTNEGKDYFWCDTADGWDYCSPKCAFIRVSFAPEGLGSAPDSPKTPSTPGTPSPPDYDTLSTHSRVSASDPPPDYAVVVPE